MNLCVSNIAWENTSEAAVRKILQQSGISAIEVAPTRLWPDWESASTRSACELRAAYAADGFTIPALQAILFGKPNLRLFGSDAERELLRAHIVQVANLAQALGAKNMVFGAPKNRLIGTLPPSTAFEIAFEFFSDLARCLTERNVCLCLEANPTDYGCTFLTTANEAARLTGLINSPGIGLQLDTACLFLAGEDTCQTLERHIGLVRHFHVSEPFLKNFSAPEINHAAVSHCLHRAGYQGWISLEMRATERPIEDVATAAQFLTRTYSHPS